MIRGTQREMIMLKGDKSSAFESVFFLIRTDATAPRGTKEDMLAEANKIIAQNRPTKKRRRVMLWESIKKSTPSFLLGALCGAICVLSVWLILA